MASRIPGAALDLFEGGHQFLWQDRRAFDRIIEYPERVAGEPGERPRLTDDGRSSSTHVGGRRLVGSGSGSVRASWN